MGGNPHHIWLKQVDTYALISSQAESVEGSGPDTDSHTSWRLEGSRPVLDSHTSWYLERCRPVPSYWLTDRLTSPQLHMVQLPTKRATWVNMEHFKNPVKQSCISRTQSNRTAFVSAPLQELPCVLAEIRWADVVYLFYGAVITV